MVSWVHKPSETVLNDPVLPDRIRNPKPPEMLFYHGEYQHKDAYPDGVDDMLGYWAENRILGGVVLFGRDHPGGRTDLDVSLHSHPGKLVLSTVVELTLV